MGQRAWRAGGPYLVFPEAFSPPALSPFFRFASLPTSLSSPLLFPPFIYEDCMFAVNRTASNNDEFNSIPCLAADPWRRLQPKKGWRGLSQCKEGCRMRVLGCWSRGLGEKGTSNFCVISAC